MSGLSRRDLWGMAVRTSFLQATFNYERQQGIGWAWALKPALDRYYPDAALRRQRLAEHTAYFNTQPTLAWLALGAVARLEERRAGGEGPDAEGVARVKSVLGSSAAALGDPLFWFTLRPFAATLGVALVPLGLPAAALALWLCYNIVHLGLRLLGVGWGYRRGPAVLGEPLRGRLTRLTQVLGLLGLGAGKYKTEILVSRDDKEVNGKSILCVIDLAAESGSTIRVRAVVPDEQEAVAALRDLVDGRFGEDP